MTLSPNDITALLIAVVSIVSIVALYKFLPTDNSNKKPEI